MFHKKGRSIFLAHEITQNLSFENYKKGTARRLVKKDQVFNRIFVDDIAGASELLIRNNKAGIFNITDNTLTFVYLV